MRRLILAAMFAAVAAVPTTAAASTSWSSYYASGDPLGETSLTLAPGEAKEVTLRFVNKGSYQWRGGSPGWRYVSLYATRPYARKSVFFSDDWHSSAQPAMLEESRVAPGATGTFRFTLRAPNTPGRYEEWFQLAVEDTAWVWNGAVTFRITVSDDAASDLGSAKAALRRIYAMRADLRSLFTDDWRAVDSPRTSGIADLEDWARQYGVREYPDLLGWYREADLEVDLPPAEVPAAEPPPALRVDPSVPAPARTGATFDPASVTADRIIVIDDASKRVLFEKDADVPHPAASITKLMTAMIVIDRSVPMWKSLALAPEDEIGGARLRVDTGTPLTVSDLMYAMLVGSANNAAHALARSTGMDMADFIAAMNAKANALGLLATTFTDPSGLDTGNVSTAREVAALAVSAFDRYTIRKMASTQKADLDAGGTVHTITNTNDLLTDDSNGLIVLGGKTGYLIESQWNLVVRVMDSRRRPLIVVVMGADTKARSFSEAAALARWAWDAHAW